MAERPNDPNRIDNPLIIKYEPYSKFTKLSWMSWLESLFVIRLRGMSLNDDLVWGTRRPFPIFTSRHCINSRPFTTALRLKMLPSSLPITHIFQKKNLQHMEKAKAYIIMWTFRWPKISWAMGMMDHIATCDFQFKNENRVLFFYFILIFFMNIFHFTLKENYFNF